ncbi:DNA mismatch repair protein MutT, partial [Streptococcus uberis]|nr:DNA mismatch repair protein MutT [Streptococcus uberis]
EELKHLKLASSMDIMLEVFLRDDVSEHFFFQENGEWKDQLK